MASDATPAITELPPTLDKAVTAMFSKIDIDNDGSITKEEAIKFWGKGFAKINAAAMFNEVDMDHDGNITAKEWKSFWLNVLKHGYKVIEVEEEVIEMMGGSAWVDWNDDRHT
uniref:EF-hand domain-containing protein n=1 Tax=Coccolithus braarudii TaxID=221442 RepID=A0A7S0L971_9EUKA|mmetsp:Transcript_27157/g.58513  ORF Transcript_27157/g.58513 Transcript_27157/m.58513 type:complete len:113 (+) Transcript_27157:3-341(+)|eukprot:CAMPEP_0183380350 /NCGR_PEP_ID=MMETSP0164_2-20130417/125889_1 /TAXON_ID=221442 /ORGANISM="Coccolithus pelagicus ssp braarudi, Strain PLY182g" /LENGTH=112 /DNA_ID=CAMNT_0025557947 /DNA_START=410 /DNA_END=748 /DNA_ORIENTATION=+